jgi:hypothetical protein
LFLSIFHLRQFGSRPFARIWKPTASAPDGSATRRGITGPCPSFFPYINGRLPGQLQPKDNGYDAFGVEAACQWESGGVSLGVSYEQNKTDPAVTKDWAVFINPSFCQSWEPFAVRFEGKIGWGKRQCDRRFVAAPPILGAISAWYLVEDICLGHP